MQTRREIIKSGLGLAGIIAAGKAPAALVRSLIAARAALTGGAKLSAKSYVKNGLVAMWDGIENAGWGVHDAAATVWKDLIGSCDGTGYNVSWDDNCAIFNGTSSRIDLASRAPFLSSDLQADFVISLSTPYQASTVFNAGGYGGYARCATISTSAQKIVTSTSGNSSQVPRNLWAISLQGRAFSIAYNSSDSVAAFEDGVASSKSGTGAVDDNSSVAHLGARQTSAGYGQYFRGRIYCLRLYSRALTAAEIAANYAIDKARFNLP